MYRGKFGWEKNERYKRRRNVECNGGKEEERGIRGRKKKGKERLETKSCLFLWEDIREGKSEEKNTQRNTRMWLYIAWQSN